MMSFHEPAWWCGSSAGPCPCRPFIEIVISTYGFLTDFVAWQIVILPAGRSSRPPVRGVPGVVFACDEPLFPCDFVLAWATTVVPCVPLLPWLASLLAWVFTFACASALVPWLPLFASAEAPELPAGPCGAFASGWLVGWFGFPAGPG